VGSGFQIAPSDELLDDAATLDAGVLRSLDAIHLAAARLFSDDLAALVTDDTRMAKATGRLGLRVDAPGFRGR
jgi:uncharacterized protein